VWFAKEGYEGKDARRWREIEPEERNRVAIEV